MRSNNQRENYEKRIRKPSRYKVIFVIWIKALSRWGGNRLDYQIMWEILEIEEAKKIESGVFNGSRRRRGWLIR